ncbi:MAG: response regulator [Desulfobacterota bacterium]|jgi:PAS domain S-box-containing protein|nr:response regulator [Thermodesulfobacteriota bacterium]
MGTDNLYKAFFDHATDAIYCHELPGPFIQVNPAACRMLGFEKAELLRMRPEDISIFRAARLETHLKSISEKGYASWHSKHIRKDGSLVDVEVRATLLEHEGRPTLLAIARDISEQKKLESRLIQAQKMEAIGTLAGGIAHDFNNLLMGIQGRISLMLMEGSPPPSFAEHLKAVEQYVQSAARLTKQILGFAREGRYEARVTDLNELVRRSSTLFGRTRKEIRIYFTSQKGLWSVEADPGQIEQVLLNLYLNAWQAMPAGGDLYLETTNTSLDKTRVSPYALEPGRFVRVCVSDTGTGMPQSVVQRIFDPFFTTKTVGRGTGLGLSTAYGIIMNHGGFIEVSSEEGEGSSFSFFLPATEKAPDPLGERPQEITRGSETVLLVDDEEMVLDVTREILEKTGYQVLTARSGREAVEVYERNLPRIALVILDMIMPDMGGEATFRRLKDLHPEVKVLISSGYSLDGAASRMLAQGCRGFVQKPFLLHELSRKLREALA